MAINFRHRILFPAIGVLLGLSMTAIGCEFVARVWFHGLSIEIFTLRSLVRQSDLLKDGLPIEVEDYLGWVPRAGYTSSQNLWGAKVTIDENGIRENGNANSFQGPPIVAVGDSFTFGDQVNDHESWPAQLESMLGIRVVNGGVCAYGVDQAAMRAKILIRQYSPRAVILGLISDDIRRTGLYMIGGLLRPYFSIEGNELKLHPIPEGKALENVERVARARSNDIFRKVFGYSSLFHVLMMRIDPEYWMVGVNEKETSQDPERIAFEVMKDLDVYLTRLGIPGFVLAQDSGIAGPSALDDRGRMIRFLKCISKTHFNLIDVYPVTYDILRKDRAEYGSLFRGHMTAKGNWLMAEILAPAIKSYFRLRDSKK